MNLKKRTQKEIDKAVKAKDYTGGYEYLPWLIYMRGFGYIAPMLGMLFGGSYVMITSEYPVSFWAGLFFVLASGVIKYALVRDYKSLKKGISH